MPGSGDTPADSATNSDLMSARPPPSGVNVSLQSWPSSDNGYGSNHGRSSSMDSLESSSSGSSSTGQPKVSDVGATDYLATRAIGKTTKLPSHNPLQFVKVQSPMYIKAEKQVQVTKEIKVTKEGVKEGEEEWQSNLDNWKSRRRKVSEKVIQRAEEMRQIEAEEQLRQEQYQQQQRKIRKFSEIVENRSSSRSYNLDLYIGQGDDSGLGGTPEPDDAIDKILRSDTSEGMTSEAESIDSDTHKSERMSEKEPPKVPQKPQSRLSRDVSVDESDSAQTSPIMNFSELPNKNLSAFDNFSSTDPSDIEGHCGDNETVSSEEDTPYSENEHNSSPIINNVCDKEINVDKTRNIISANNKNSDKPSLDAQTKDEKVNTFKLLIKAGDNKGFGFTLKGGKDQRCPPYIDTITNYGAADLAGLKEKDQVVSLNGEKAAASSQASLIFCIKQAAYTGVLDIVVNQSFGKNSLPTDLQNKSSNRKSAFAEKLALFSSSVNGTITNDEEKCPKTTIKNGCAKPESLVLRRRSAFETGKNDNYITNRRSSCLTQENCITNSENVKKRLSVDFAISNFDIQENSFKKGPPPPVPTKPKIRPKMSVDFSNSVSENINKPQECFNISLNSNIHDNLTEDEPMNNYSAELSVNKSILEIPIEQLKLEDEKFNSPQKGTIDISEEMKLPQSINNDVCDNSIRNKEECCNQKIINVSSSEFSNEYECNSKLNPVIGNVNNNDIVDDRFLENTLSFSTQIFPVAVCDTTSSQMEVNSSEHIPDIPILKRPTSEPLITVSFTSNDHSDYDGEMENFSDSTFIYSESQTDKVSCVPTNDEMIQENIDLAQISMLEEEICYENAVPFDIPKESQTNSQLNPPENICNVEFVNEFSENKNYEVGSLEEASHIQINSSPLCLPLEKIDEDDVISASTTTSSETPDTETVIETLPLNVSPLPNDESDGEESSKTIEIQETESKQVIENVVESASIGFAMHGESESSGFSEVFAKDPTKGTNDPKNTSIYTEDENNEYQLELEESLDQITSLDVIDEIEKQLMHQLECQGDAYEELGEGLTSDLEINKQWLYLTEESDLLDDLTPRNVEPPNEPPPPPPPAEMDDIEQTLAPMPRLNSTKRIKKELWRRRSDFLGLDSPSVLDVDNLLPPPPPGIEEILKQEREQNQWLEKRLSLAESEITSPLYSSEPPSVEPLYNQGDYAHYFLEEDLPETAASQTENWKDNLNADISFDPSCDMKYIPVADVLPATDGTKAEESPQRKAKQNLHNLGAAPKAKIIDSTNWITEQVIPVSKKSVEPVFHQSSYNQNYWLTQDDERKRMAQNAVDRRLSMPHFSSHQPDVTIRTWGDREYEFQKQRPRSALWNPEVNKRGDYGQYSNKQDILRSHSLDSHRENYDVDTLESEVHNCSCCGKGLCEGSAMGIEALRLYFHIECFRCCICCMPLGNGTCGTDVQVKNNHLYCSNCFTVD